MATGTRGSARRGRRAATRQQPGWAIVAATTVVAVVWFGALAFGFPGQRSAGASPATSTDRLAARSLAAGRDRAHAGSAVTTPPAVPRSASRTASAAPTTTAGRPVSSAGDLPTSTGSAPSAPTRTDDPTTPPHSTRPPQPDESEQHSCPAASRTVQQTAPVVGSRRTIALTFDDGPGEATPEVLDILAREHVHATFFVVGREVKAHPGLVRRASQEGHLIGNHTYDHVYPRDLRGGWTSRYLTGQLRGTAAAVHRETGLPTCFFRPPGGFMPSTVPSVTRKLRMTTSLWSVDTRDWAVQGPHAPSHDAAAKQARTIAGRAMGGGSPGLHPIVLFHDGGGYRGSTADALTRVIRWYKARGFTFVRLDGQV